MSGFGGDERLRDLLEVEQWMFSDAFGDDNSPSGIGTVDGSTKRTNGK